MQHQTQPSLEKIVQGRRLATFLSIACSAELFFCLLFFQRFFFFFFFFFDFGFCCFNVPGPWSHCNTCGRNNCMYTNFLNALAYSHKTCYRTCMTEEPLFGDEECTACITDVDNEPIEIIAPQDSEMQSLFTVRIILSPNFPNEFYPESILCRYFTTR